MWELDMRGLKCLDYFFKYAVRMRSGEDVVMCVYGFDTLNEALDYLKTQTLEYRLVV